MAGVFLEHVTKRFGEVTAVQDVSLEVIDREFLVLVGPSGCGKSTILRMIAGLEDASSGTIRIGDRVVNNVPPRDRDIAMVFQNYALYPHMSVSDNLSFALTLRHVSRDEIRRRVQATAESLGIEKLLHRKPKELSGGQRQRVALGRAIIREPQVFLMDEPLSNLDAKLRVQTRAELIKLHRRLQTTVIYVTHDQVEAMTMGDRIAILRDGMLQQLDAPEAVYARPANMFVAGFIGSPAMNFVSGQLEATDGSLHARAPGMQIELPAERARRLSKNSRKVIIGIRPEDIHDSPSVAAQGWPATAAGVDVVEHMGNEVFVHLNVGDAQLTARMSPSVRPEPGKPLSISFNADQIHLFDPETEAALL